MATQTELVLHGVVTSGKGRSTRHMRRRDYTPLGYQPVPGTLNVRTGEKAARKVRRLPGGVPIQQGDEIGLFHPMTLAGIDVHVCAFRRGVEVVAPVRLRDALDLTDGDAVTLRWPRDTTRQQRTTMRGAMRSALKRAHRRNADILLRAARSSLRRGVDLYQGGQRNIDERWEFIRVELKRQEAKSVLDLGCAEGTFIRRAAEELGCIGIGIERNLGPVLSGEVDRLITGRSGYAVIRATMDPDSIRRLPQVDVTLCLSVVHHVINKGGLEAGRDFLEAIVSITRRAVIFEMGAPKHPDFVDSQGRARKADEQATAVRALLESAGLVNVRQLGRTPGFKGKYQRDVFAAEKPALG